MASHDHALNAWSFTGLVGAFLDLSIAFFLLCSSTLAFFATKFLAFFGLILPCPCNGLFGVPNDSRCFHRLLVDLPTGKVSSVQLSVKKNFPFDEIMMNRQYGHGRNINTKLLTDDGYRSDPFVEMEEEGSCSSAYEVAFRDSKKNNLVGYKIPSGRGKGVSHQKPPRPSGARRRRRSLVDSSGRRVTRDRARDLSCGSGRESTKDEDNSVRGYRSEDSCKYDKDTQGGNLSDDTKRSFQLSDVLGETKSMGKDESSSWDVGCLDLNDEGAMRILEQALEEEHAARTALYQELEKERNAAASAADEAMAMILRVQKEKASIEMEARHYQKMIEEKSSYDAEEMDILKEILVRREKEKHFLENELEAYRLIMLNGSEQLVGDMQVFGGMFGQRPSLSSESSDDAMLMLQQISESLSKGVLPVEKQSHGLAFGEESASHGWDEAGDVLKRGDARRSTSIEKDIPCGPGFMGECTQEFQEKEIVSMKEHSFASSQSQEHISLDKTIISVNEEQEKHDQVRLHQGIDVKTDQCHSETNASFPCDSAFLEKHMKDTDQDGNDQHSSISEAEPSVLDVHVIDDKSEVSNPRIYKSSGSISRDVTPDEFRNYFVPSDPSGFRRTDISNDHGSRSRGDEPVIQRGRSGMSSCSERLQGSTVLSDLRQNSMSAVDNERLKLEHEVELLRGRLKIVQQGREKLSFPVEHLEREKHHLQLLEDIAKQLQEIRQITEPGKVECQASLPPLSSKRPENETNETSRRVTDSHLKKRRCCSGSWGVVSNS